MRIRSHDSGRGYLSIDTRTEGSVQRDMDAHLCDRTTFVIAHRLSLLRRILQMLCVCVCRFLTTVALLALLYALAFATLL